MHGRYDDRKSADADDDDEDKNDEGTIDVADISENTTNKSIIIHIPIIPRINHECDTEVVVTPSAEAGTVEGSTGAGAGVGVGAELLLVIALAPAAVGAFDTTITFTVDVVP
jgi:hypothetical protein